jgi:hypothetical protein
MSAFHTFWHLDMHNFHAINEGILILIPKSSEASTLKDFQPIALIHLIGKLFSKVLANRLALRLASLIHPIQSAFIKGRVIQDNCRYVHSAAKTLHVRNKSSLLLMVDIAHAFDSVVIPAGNYAARQVSSVVERLGLDTSSLGDCVCLNGTQGSRICHARGLRQGDLLSPMLFVLVMEILGALIRKADEWGIFSRIGVQAIKHRTSLYANDFIMFLSPTPSDLELTKSILQVFQEASGLGCREEFGCDST